MASRIPFPVIRVFALAAVGVGASGYALVRYYTFSRPAMVVQVPRDAGDGWDALQELPAPSLEPGTR